MKTTTKKNQKDNSLIPQHVSAAESAVAHPKKKDKYFFGIGRRKTSVVQARLYPQKKTDIQILDVSVNENAYDKYFVAEKLRVVAVSPINLLNLQNRFKITALANGGGKSAQAEAMRLAIARALIEANPIFKKPLKRAKYLTRDARKKERKKPGLKKARRAPQWQKR